MPTVTYSDPDRKTFAMCAGETPKSVGTRNPASAYVIHIPKLHFVLVRQIVSHCMFDRVILNSGVFCVFCEFILKYVVAEQRHRHTDPADQTEPQGI